MSLTFPPILIPLTLFVLVFCLGKYWFPAFLKDVQANDKVSRKRAIAEIVIIPLASLGVMLFFAHIAGHDDVSAHAFQSIAHSLLWSAQGLFWDCLHPFAYGFSLSV